MPGLIHAGDWHLSRLTWQHRSLLTGDSFHALARIVDLCLHRRAALFAAGDLLDKDKPDSAAVACMHHEMDRMEQAGLPVFYIQGQHEKADPPWMASHKWPKHVHNTVFTVPGIPGAFYGLDWVPREQFVEFMSSGIPADCHSMLAHQVWMEHMGNVVTVPEANVHDLPPQIRLVFTGDYHVHQQTRYMTQSGEKVLISSGSISMRSITEQPQKSVWYFDGQNLESVPIPGRPVINTNITSLEQIQQLADWAAEAGKNLPEELRAPICVLKFPSELQGAFATINRIFANAHLWLEEQRPGILPQEVILSEAAANATSLPELIAANVPEGDPRDLLLELVSSSLSPKEAVRALVARLNPLPPAKGADAPRTPDNAKLV